MLFFFYELVFINWHISEIQICDYIWKKERNVREDFKAALIAEIAAEAALSQQREREKKKIIILVQNKFKNQKGDKQHFKFPNSGLISQPTFSPKIKAPLA